MSKLVPPHGSQTLKPLLLEGKALRGGDPEGAEAQEGPDDEPGDVGPHHDGDRRVHAPFGVHGLRRLEALLRRRTSSPPPRTSSGPFRSRSRPSRGSPTPIKIGDEVALWDSETDALMGTMKVTEKYVIDKEYECKQVFRTDDTKHPGVEKVMAQAPVNLAGPVKVVSESYYPEMFKGIYQRPAEARKVFEERGWTTVAALQLRNPMHGSHAYLAWIAIEVCDGVYIHQLVGKLKEGDIPADVRVRAIDALVNKYFRKERVIQGGYPMEMRYAGPREALLHAVFRQNYGCSHLIVGRDHAGRRRLLRSVRRAEDLPRDPVGRPRPEAPAARLDVLLLRVRGDGLDEDLSPREQGRHRRERPVQGRRAPAALRHPPPQADERRQAGAIRVLEARGHRHPEGVLRHPRA